MAADDLESIVPDKLKQIGSRKFLLFEALIILVLLIVVIVLAALLDAKRGGAPVTCTTPDCLHLAGYLADNMDTTVSPCQDFHRYACGGFRIRHHLAPDEPEVTMIQMMSDDVDERLREMIENPTGRGAPKTPGETKLRDFFLSCVHDYGRTREGGRVLVDLIREKLGGWYVLDPRGWNGSWNLQEALARVQGELIVNVFFEAYMQRKPNSNRNTLILYPADPGMFYSDYLDNEIGVQDAYKDYMRRVAVLLIRDANLTVTPSDEAVRVEQFVSDVFDLENRLATEMSSLEEQGLLFRGVTTTVGEIDRNFTQLNWLKVIERMFEDLAITEDTQLRLVGPLYYSTINELLLNETEANTKDRIMNNFFAWKVADRFASDLSFEYQDSKTRFLNAMFGEQEPEPTWKACMQTVRTRLGTLLATEFIRSHLGPDVRPQVTEMVDYIRTAIVERIPDLPWMDGDTQRKAVQRVSKAKVTVGYSEMYYNKTAMEELHSLLEIDREAGYFRNLLSVNRFQRRTRVRLLLENEARFIDHLPLLGYDERHFVEPYYFGGSYETLFVPAAAMLDPMYNGRRPQVVNFGILGSLVGGQMLKAVGFNGRYSYVNGSYGVWWTNATSYEYRRASLCFVRYFDGLTAGPFLVDERNLTVSVSGNLQTRRLMEDFGGIRTAYRAYKDWISKAGSEALPAGISLTPDQVFFVASAQTKCYLRAEEEAYNLAKEGYLPEDLEMNSLLRHMPEFSSAFSCPVGSNMRSDALCQLY